MRYVLLTYNAPDAREAWDAMTPTERRAEENEYVQLVEAMRHSNSYVAAVEFDPSATTHTVRVGNGTVSVTGGPATTAEESLTGYFVIEVDSIESAIDWASKIPNARNGSVEVRKADESELADRIARAASEAAPQRSSPG